jgi:hypothetical protein
MSNFIELLLLKIYHTSRTNTNQWFLLFCALKPHNNHPHEDLAKFGTYSMWVVHN